MERVQQFRNTPARIMTALFCSVLLVLPWTVYKWDFFYWINSEKSTRKTCFDGIALGLLQLTVLDWVRLSSIYYDPTRPRARINNSKWLPTGAHYWEPATPIMRQCNGIFTDQSIFRYFSREIGQLQSTWARSGEDKTIRPHVNMSTSCRHVNISTCLWLQLVTEVPVGIWIEINSN